MPSPKCSWLSVSASALSVVVMNPNGSISNELTVELMDEETYLSMYLALPPIAVPGEPCDSSEEVPARNPQRQPQQNKQISPSVQR